MLQHSVSILFLVIRSRRLYSERQYGIALHECGIGQYLICVTINYTIKAIVRRSIKSQFCSQIQINHNYFQENEKNIIIRLDSYYT